jgi:Tol biopolymer transport system component/DNA-binding winged helix-turn-helix (wHTH) protein
VGLQPRDKILSLEFVERMAIHPQLPARLYFGPFEVNPAAAELLNRGVRIRLSGQPFQILLVLLAYPGSPVTREQLRADVWSEGTFVDFDHGLNAAMNKLRRALHDSAENPRYIETLPGCGYRFIGILENRLSTPAPTAGKTPIASQRVVRRGWLAATACVAVSAAVAVWLHGDQNARPRWNLTRLTSDVGLSSSPAMSRDGKLVAYSSDRGNAGGQDLYVRQVAGGQPIRLTFDGAGNTTPDFSVDGSRILFRSSRDGGGVYEIPSFGGEVRLLARDGLNPRYSPDGTQVVYWVGAPGVAAAVPGSGSVWVVPALGGTPRRVGANLSAARNPVWSPNGKHLLFVGHNSAEAFDDSGIDWWVSSANGEGAVRSGAHQALVQAGLKGPDYRNALSAIQQNVPSPACWSATDNSVIFAGDIGDSRNLWEIEVSPQTGKVSGAPSRLTTGAADEREPSCGSGGTFVFANIETSTDIWSLSVDPDSGRPISALERITQVPAVRAHPSLSGNGRSVTFSSNQGGQNNIWIRDLASGKESSLATSPDVQRYPEIDATGTRIAFSVYEKDKRAVYVSTPGGQPERLCEGCLRATDWSSDGKSLLTFGGNPYQVNVLDIASHLQAPILKHANYSLLYARYSPDNRWVSFTVRTRPGHARIVIAPLDRPKPVPGTAWISIAEVGTEDWADWSTDGNKLYFTSGRDGHGCLWAQRVDADSRQPVGEAFAVQHFHGRMVYRQGGWSAVGGRIAVVLAEDHGNVWMMSRSDKP